MITAEQFYQRFDELEIRAKCDSTRRRALTKTAPCCRDITPEMPSNADGTFDGQRINDILLLDHRHFVLSIRDSSYATRFCVYRVDFAAAHASLKNQFIISPGECPCGEDEWHCG